MVFHFYFSHDIKETALVFLMNEFGPLTHKYYVLFLSVIMEIWSAKGAEINMIKQPVALIIYISAPFAFYITIALL